MKVKSTPVDDPSPGLFVMELIYKSPSASVVALEVGHAEWPDAAVCGWRQRNLIMLVMSPGEVVPVVGTVFPRR